MDPYRGNDLSGSGSRLSHRVRRVEGNMSISMAAAIRSRRVRFLSWAAVLLDL